MAPSISVLSADQTAAIARALSDRRRFAIFEQIARSGTMLCSGLAQHETITAATISHHLKELAESGLVETLREGRAMRLSINRPVWNAYLHRLQSL